MAEHPITPPPELFAKWFANSLETLDRKVSRDDTGTTGLIAGEVAIQAARWGADQELEACCREIQSVYGGGSRLRIARRPKPPSDKELALKALALIERTADAPVPTNKESLSLIRRALEQLP